MDAVTYPTPAVNTFITEHFVPLRLNYDDITFSSEFSVIWTPELLVLDNSGTEFHRAIGFHEPDDLIAVLLLGVAKVNLHKGAFDAATMHLNEVVEKYPRNHAAAEAVFFRGVTLFKEKNDPQELKKALQVLQAQYPESSWARRAAPYQLL